MKPRSCSLLLFAVALLFRLLVPLSYSKPPEFKEIPQAELALSEPKVDPEADIEYLYRKDIVNDRIPGSDLRRTYYRRLKIFTQKGVDELDVLKVYYEKSDSKIMNFGARVTNPDGSTVTLDKSDLYESKTYEYDDYEQSVKSFSFPKLQVGSIVEYEWTEKQMTYSLPISTRFLDARWPTRRLVFEFIPYRGLPSVVQGINCGESVGFEKGDKSTYLVKAENIPAKLNEPQSPSDFDLRPWVYLRYLSDNDLLELKDYWAEQSDALADETRNSINPGKGAVRRLAKTLYEGTDDSEEMLRRAYEYCTQEVKNIYAAQSDFTAEEREDAKEAGTPKDTITRGYGTGMEINYLFASLAGAAGYDARLATCGDATSLSFDVKVRWRGMMLPESVIAIRKNEEDDWRFFDPGFAYLPFGYLDAANMGKMALIADKKEAIFGTTQTAHADFSALRREANFELSASGDLSGDVKIVMSGYVGVREKRRYDDLSESEREERYREQLENRLNRFELKDFKMENLFSREEPLIISYRLEVLGYAESLGKRIFFQPNVFEYGTEPEFTKEHRRAPIVYRFPWKESDEIWIRFPEGYALQEAASPGRPINLESLKFSTQFAVTKSETKMRCQREFECSSSGFEAESYGTLKGLYDLINKQDTHALTLVEVE